MNRRVIEIMLHQHNQAQTLYHPKWQEQGWNNDRAIRAEAMEGLNSQGWTWWKKQTTDAANCRMELIDIWHFMLNRAIVEAKCPTVDHPEVVDKVVEMVAPLIPATIKEAGAVELWEMLIFDTRNYAAYAMLCDIYNLDSAGFVRLYYVKNQLNILRAVSGYQQGKYKKMWPFGTDMVEDNVVAMHLAGGIDFINDDGAVRRFYKKLDLYYRMTLDEVDNG